MIPAENFSEINGTPNHSSLKPFQSHDDLIAQIRKDSENTIHSPLGASSMHRWAKCPGSINLIKELNLKPVTSSYAEEGTLAHGYLKYALLGLAPLTLIPEENGMREAIAFALDCLRSEIAETYEQQGDFSFKQTGFSEVECSFSLEHIHPGCHGTADVVIYQRRSETLVVADYKHGMGHIVEVDNNPQLLTYALGAYLNLSRLLSKNNSEGSKTLRIKKIRLQIIQPRADHASGNRIRSFDTTPFELIDFAGSFRAYALATHEHNAPLVPGEEQCGFCPVKAFCPGLRSVAMKEALTVFEGVDKKEVIPTPENLAQLEKALNFIPLLKTWMTGVQEYAYSMANHGVKIPGYKLVEKRASRKWKNETEVIKFLESNKIDPQMFMDMKVKSPPSLEKALKLKKKEMAVLEPFIEKVSSGSTLVPETDNRIALDKSPDKVFGEIEGE